MSVSVVITCHNEERFIGEAIQSVINQTSYNDILEIIVINDGSTDDSQLQIERKAKNIDKLKTYVTSGIGVSAARNLGVSKSQGEFIAFLDGDDIWKTNKIEVQLKAISADRANQIGFVYCNYYDFTGAIISKAVAVRVNVYKPETPDFLEKYFVNDGPIVPSMMLIRRAVYESVGGFDESLVMSEDTDLCFRIGMTHKFMHINQELVYKRRHDNNVTKSLLVFADVYEEITRKFIRMCPGMARLEKKRNSRNYVKIGTDCIESGEYFIGLRYLYKAIIFNPFALSGYLRLVTSFLPDFLRVKIVGFAKYVHHRRWSNSA